MSNLVRVRHAVTGHEYTVVNTIAEADGDLIVLDEPAIHPVSQNPLPPKLFVPPVEEVVVEPAAVAATEAVVEPVLEPAEVAEDADPKKGARK